MTKLQKIAEAAGQSSLVTLAGLQWRESYNNYQTVVANWLTLSISWTSVEGYKVAVNGRRLKPRFSDVSEAANFAVHATHSLLKSASAALKGLPL